MISAKIVSMVERFPIGILGSSQKGPFIWVKFVITTNAMKIPLRKSIYSILSTVIYIYIEYNKIIYFKGEKVLRYSLEENVVFAEVKDKVRVIFFDSDDLYTLSGFVGKIVTLSPKNLTAEEILSKIEEKYNEEQIPKREKFNEIIDALVKLKILNTQK